jgi:hypothetical protein
MDLMIQALAARTGRDDVVVDTGGAMAASCSPRGRRDQCCSVRSMKKAAAGTRTDSPTTM